MPLIFPGKTPCALCGDTLGIGDEVVATSGVPVPDGSALLAYQDAGMHQECFLKWELRALFVRTFNEYYDEHFRGIKFMRDDGFIYEREPHAGRAV